MPALWIDGSARRRPGACRSTRWAGCRRIPDAYRDWNVKHFHEHLRRQAWVRVGLHLDQAAAAYGGRWSSVRAAGGASAQAAAQAMRRDDAASGRQPRLPGLRSAPLDLIVTMDDATSTIYSAFLVEEEGTASTFRALLEVFLAKGLPSSLYTDRGSHYFFTPKAAW